MCQKVKKGENCVKIPKRQKLRYWAKNSQPWLWRYWLMDSDRLLNSRLVFNWVFYLFQNQSKKEGINAAMLLWLDKIVSRRWSKSHKEMTTKIHFLNTPSIQTIFTNFSVFYCSVCNLHSSQFFVFLFFLILKEKNRIRFFSRVSIFFRSI